MIYQVMLSENQSVLIHDVDIVQYDEDTVLFREEKGNFIAAFKMYNIVGFFRMDVPTPDKPKEYKWDFDLIDANTRKQQEEAEKKKPSKYGYKYEDLFSFAEDYLKEHNLSYTAAKESMNEVLEECFNRGGIAPKGGNTPLYVRNMIKGKIKCCTDEYELLYLNNLLKRNMEHCIHGYDVYGGKDK